MAVRAGRKGIVVLGMVGAAALGTAVYDQMAVKVLKDGTTFNGQDVSGLTEAQLRERVTQWWAEHKDSKIQLVGAEIRGVTLDSTPAELGAELDVVATLNSGPFARPSQLISHRVQSGKGTEVQPQFVASSVNVEKVKAFLEKNGPETEPASVEFAGGKIVRKYEVPSWSLDESLLDERIVEATEKGTAQLPLKTAPKEIPDADLDRIKVVVAEFSTTFPTSKVNRCKNIKQASEMIDGTILMPGAEWSFNEHLGPRTVAKGFYEAGVFVSGRRETDIGGGICQVSTTLYNALLVADLKVLKRSPHSLPVNYIPMGRDAAVSYPNPDLKFKNTFDFPIAVSATYAPGKVTFRILGERKNDFEVTFERKFLGSWSHGTKTVVDTSLPYGVTRVMDRGGNGQRWQVWRVLKRDGREIRRDNLGESVYRGGPRIVASNPNAKPPSAATGSTAAPVATGSAAPPAQAPRDLDHD